MRFLSLPAFAALVLATACESSSAPNAAAGSATSAVTALAPTASAAPAEPAAPKPAPDDLDVAAAQKSLKCASDAHGGACGILAKAKACAPWTPNVPSGEGRFIGRGTAVEKGKARDTFVVMRVHRVPTSEVAPGQMGVKIGFAEIPKEESAFAQADRAIRAYERADSPPHGNAALDYLKTLAQWPDAYAMKTTSGQVDVLTGEGAFLCQGPKQEIVLVERASKASGDGLYAELWATSW